MTVSALYQVWETSDLAGSHLLAMMHIADNADPISGKLFVSTRRIALLARVPEANVASLISDLVEFGEITAEQCRSIVLGDGYLVTMTNYRELDKAGAINRYRLDRPQINWALRQEVFERDGYRCRYCGTGANLSIDHMVPFSKGGADSSLNLVTCCRSCNSRKGARTPDEVGMVLRNPFVEEVLV